MKKMLLSALLGLVTWIVVATIVNRLLRTGMAGYAEVEATMAFTPSMLTGRLLLGAVASLGAGYVAAWVSGSAISSALKALIGVLLVIFIPMHVALWSRFPAWYHLVFLASLVVVPLAGAKLRGFTRTA